VLCRSLVCLNRYAAEMSRRVTCLFKQHLGVADGLLYPHRVGNCGGRRDHHLADRAATLASS
jgi:hypothetical protein